MIRDCARSTKKQRGHLKDMLLSVSRHQRDVSEYSHSDVKKTARLAFDKSKIKNARVAHDDRTAVGGLAHRHQLSKASVEPLKVIKRKNLLSQRNC